MAEQKTINPQMIVLARETRGVSQSVLAEKLEISTSKMSFVELGQQTLTEDLENKMAKFLKYPLDFFFQEGESYSSMGLTYRKRDHVSAKVLNPLEAQINLYRLHIEILSQKIKLPAPNVPALDLNKYESLEKLAKDLRKKWQIPQGPITNLTKLLEENGIIVVAFDFGTERVDSRTILTKDKHPIIFVNKLHLADRQRFSLAYELGHLVMHMHAIPSAKRDIAHEANKFAAGFLMPESEVKKDLERGVSLPQLGELKKKWRVSMISLLYRAEDTGVITENRKRYVVTLFNNMKIRKREPVFLDFQQEKPKLLRDLIMKYKNAHKFTAKELAKTFHLEVEEFMSRYAE